MTMETRLRFGRIVVIGAATFAVSVLLVAAGAVKAQQLCVPYEAAAAQLEGKFGEQVVGRGLMKGGKAMVEVFASETGTWTAVITDARGRACIVASGSDWGNLQVLAEDDVT